MPFIFVPRGAPPPLEWMARHPGWVKFPAFMVPRGSPPPTPADFIAAFGHPDDAPPREAGAVGDVTGQTGMPAGTETGVVEASLREKPIPVHPDPAASMRAALPVFRDRTQGAIVAYLAANATLDPVTAYRRITSLLDDPAGAIGSRDIQPLKKYTHVQNNPLNHDIQLAQALPLPGFVPPPPDTTASDIDGAARALSNAIGSIFNNESSDDRPPAGSRPIDQTPWSGDHQQIKSAIGAGPKDRTRISPQGEVWSQNPDGSWTNYGPASDYTGSGRPSGQRGKDRE